MIILYALHCSEEEAAPANIPQPCASPTASSIKALHPASASSSRSTTTTTAAQEPVSSPGTSTVTGAGDGLDRNCLVELPVCQMPRSQDAKMPRCQMPAPFVSAKVCSTLSFSNAIPSRQAASLQGRPCVPPALLTVNWTTRGGDNYSMLLEFGKDGSLVCDSELLLLCSLNSTYKDKALEIHFNINISICLCFCSHNFTI